MRLVAIALLATAVGCGAHHPRRPRAPIRPAEWRAVLEDWYPDGVVDHAHPCAAIVLARIHLPVDGSAYSTVDRDLRRAEKRWCTPHRDLEDLAKGMSDSDVGGVPDAVGPRCWLYRGIGGEDGRRLCFTRGRVTTLQVSVHG